MSANVPSRGPARAPWLLPVILAIIIVLIVLAVIFGNRIKNALNSPTATPVVKTVVVTSTPGGATSTPGTPGTATAANNPAIPPSATPASGVGVVTPLPSTTPVPTVPGLQLGEIARKQVTVTEIQSAADKGNSHYRYYLDPRQVVQNNLPAYGFTQGFQIVSPAPSPTPTPYKGSDGRLLVKFEVEYLNHVYTVFTAQPATQGPKGIWVIVTILPGRV